MRLARRVPLVFAAALCLAGSGCSDDETISKQAFVDQLKAQTPPIDPGIASCVYDNVKSDRDVMADLTKYGAGSDRISQSSDDKLQRLLARCIRGAEGSG